MPRHDLRGVLRGGLSPGPVPTHPNAREVGSQGFAVGGVAEGSQEPPGRGVGEGVEMGAYGFRAGGGPPEESEGRSHPTPLRAQLAVQEGGEASFCPCQGDRRPGSKPELQIGVESPGCPRADRSEPFRVGRQLELRGSGPRKRLSRRLLP